MIVIPLSPDKFAQVKTELESNKQILNKTETEPNSGTFSTSQVDISYHYNGVDTLDLTVLAKHGAAHFASEDVIKSHITALLEIV
jgi:allophanate hydrolase subunit 1